MPLLVTLKLRTSTLSYRSPAGPTTQKYWFAGTTPRLRHISFHRLLAPWDDPIYTNLVSLALHYPSVPITPPELADVLARSPRLQELVLQGALEPPLAPAPADEQRAPVALPHLAHLHVEINRSGFDRDGGSRVIRLFLSLIRPGPHCRLHIETDDLGAFPAPPPGADAGTDARDADALFPFSRVLQHTDTLRIAAVRNRIELHGCRGLDVFWSYIAAYETFSLGEFDTPDFRSPALLAGLLHVADRAGVPWERISTLSVAVSDRGVENLGTRAQPQQHQHQQHQQHQHQHQQQGGPAAPKPPYFNFFTRLFRKCVNVRRLSLATTNPTGILVNTLAAGCRGLADVSIEGNIKDPLLLSLWVQERGASPQQCAAIATLVVKHRSEHHEGRDMTFSEFAEIRNAEFGYEALRDDAKARLSSIVPAFEWQELPPDHREAVISWRDSWDDVEFIL
jgi:hypothetical protein